MEENKPTPSSDKPIEVNQDELLIQLGKDILKKQVEMYNPVFRVEVVPVADIIKCFDKLGVKIEDEINF